MSDDRRVIFDFEDKLRIPPPLDPHIASLSIRTGANNPAEHFDLMVSASFGIETVILNSGQEKIEVEIAIRKAEIQFDTINCNLLLSSLGASELWAGHQRSDITKSEKVLRKTNHTILGGTANLNPKVAGHVGTEGARSAERVVEQAEEVKRALKPWRLVTPDTIQIGYLDNFDRRLTGRVIDEDVTVRVQPLNVRNKVGVLGRIRVRERWIDISDVRPVRASEKLRSFLAEISGNDETQSRTRHLFEKLLAHLVAIELQEEGESRDATLAASAIVYTPRLDHFTGVGLPRSRREIKIDPTAIENFIGLNSANQRDVLLAMGVDLDAEDTSGETMDFLRVWHDFDDRKWFRESVPLDNILKAMSQSFGRELFFSETQLKRSSDSIWKMKISDQLAPVSSELEIINFLGGDRFGEAAAIFYGVLLREEDSYRIARCFGFNMSFEEFERTICECYFDASYGKLVTFHRLFELIGRSDIPVLLREVELPIMVPAKA